MAKYYCKCGSTFQKSGDSGTTGNRLKEYGPQHECHGCPYALPVVDNRWDNKSNSWSETIRAWECRTSQRLNYDTYADLSLGSKTVGSVYSLDFPFLQEIQSFIQQTDGISTDRGKPGERGVQYGTDGLYRLPVYPDQNKKGIEAKQALFDRFFLPNGNRKDVVPGKEREIILERIEGATMGKINIGNISAGLNKVKGITQNLKSVAKHELVPTEYIKVGYDNPYAVNDTQQSRYELAMSLKVNGLLNPLLVNKKSDTEYWLISGEHRLSAIKENLNWPTVSCMVYDNISDNQAKLMLHAVNLDVREYTTAQKLQFYQQTEQLLMQMKESGEFTGAIQQGIAETLKVSTRQARKYKKIVERLSPEDQQRVIDGELSIDKAYQMTMPSASPKEASVTEIGGTSDLEASTPDPNQLYFNEVLGKDDRPVPTGHPTQDKDGGQESDIGTGRTSEFSDMPSTMNSRETDSGSTSNFASGTGIDHHPQNGGDGQEYDTGRTSGFDSNFWDEKVKFAIKKRYDCKKLFRYYKSQIPTVQEAIKDILKPPYGNSGGNFDYPDKAQGWFTQRSNNADIEYYDGKTRHRCTITYTQVDAYIRQMIRANELLDRKSRKEIQQQGELE